MKFFKTICWTFAILFLASALVPVFYNIFHIGNIILLVLGLLLFIFPFFLKKGRLKKPLKAVIISIYAIITATVLGLSAFMLHESYFKKPPTTGKQTLIVLGCHVVGDQPSFMLWKRLLVALDYLNENPDSVVITSGGQGDDEMYPEGLVMANFLIARGIDPERVIIEDRSRNTEENLAFSYDFIPDDSQGVVIITDHFHQARSVMIAQQLGMKPVYTRSSFTPYSLAPSYWFRDMGGVPLTWLKDKFQKTTEVKIWTLMK